MLFEDYSRFKHNPTEVQLYSANRSKADPNNGLFPCPGCRKAVCMCASEEKKKKIAGRVPNTELPLDHELRSNSETNKGLLQCAASEEPKKKIARTVPNTGMPLDPKLQNAGLPLSRH